MMEKIREVVDEIGEGNRVGLCRILLAMERSFDFMCS